MPSFKQSLDQFGIEVQTLHAKNVEQVEDYVYNMVRARSPVDLGAYKANHNRSSDKPNYYWDEDKRSGREPAPTGGKFPTFFVSTGC